MKQEGGVGEISHGMFEMRLGDCLRESGAKEGGANEARMRQLFSVGDVQHVSLDVQIV